MVLGTNGPDRCFCLSSCGPESIVTGLFRLKRPPSPQETQTCRPGPTKHKSFSLKPKKHVWTGKFVWGGLESLFIFCGLGSLFQSKLDTVFILDMFRFFFGGEDFLNFVELKIRFNLVGKCGCG